MKKLVMFLVALVAALKIGYILGIAQGIDRMRDPGYRDKVIRSLVYSEPWPSWKEHLRQKKQVQEAIRRLTLPARPSVEDLLHWVEQEMGRPEEPFWMSDYIVEVKRQFRDVYGIVPSGGTEYEPTFAEGVVPDGTYPMEINGRVDYVYIEGGMINCGNFEDEIEAQEFMLHQQHAP